MLIAHRIELDQTEEQETYFRRACGTTRFVWNWALAEWNRQYEAGGRPTALKLKKQFNALKYTDHPWLEAVHRDSHAQPFANLSKAWTKYFDDLREGKDAHRPVFKKRGKCRDSFYVANDKLKIEEKRVRLPVIGWVRIKEPLRFGGKIMGATVGRDGMRWYLSVQVDVEVSWLAKAQRRKTIGVDVNVKEIVSSNGDRHQAPRPLAKMKRKLALLQRSISRKLQVQIEAKKKELGLDAKARLPKGTRLVASKNREKASRKLSDQHRKIRCVRNDFTHKLTSKLSRENQTVVIEDLSVKGMTASAKGTAEKPGKNVRQKSGLNRAILDVAFGEFRRQIEYKAARYESTLAVADRFYPSSKRCSCCGEVNHDLTLKDRTWTCGSCETTHDRDLNASVNLEQLVLLPEASMGVQVSTPSNIGMSAWRV